jgi:hypothetical protein
MFLVVWIAGAIYNARRGPRVRRRMIGDGGGMSRANVAAAKRIYEARNRGDVDAVLAECDPDVTWRAASTLTSRSLTSSRSKDGTMMGRLTGLS